MNEFDITETHRSRLAAVFMLIVAVLSLSASVAGVFIKDIYGQLITAGLLTETLRVGSIAQDIIFIPLSLILAFCSVRFLMKPGYKTYIAMIGLTGNFLYGYGLYAIQGQYTSIYIAYLAIFSLSVYSIVLGLLSFKREFALTTGLPKGTRLAVSGFLYFIPVVLGLIWIMRLSSDVQHHTPQATYGVFVLDLCIVFPALAVSATALIRKKAFGVIFAGAALMKVLTVCLSWGFGELYSRIEGYVQGNYEMLALPSFLTAFSLVLIIIFMLKAKPKERG